jgi:transposase
VGRMANEKKTRRPRRTFTDEFKQGAVALVLDEKKSVAETARNLDVAESVLRGWLKQAEADRSGGKTGLTTEERAELARLGRENRVLRMERDILKKAAVFFAKENA